MLSWRKDKGISIIICYESTIAYLASIRLEYLSIKTIIFISDIIVSNNVAHLQAPGRE